MNDINVAPRDTTTFREVWSSRHFHFPARDKKDKLKAAQALVNTMRYHTVVGSGGKLLKDVFAESVVIPLLPDPSRPEQWQDQWTDAHIRDVVWRALCNEDGQYNEPTVLATIAAASMFADTKDEFYFICGSYKGGYQSEIKRTLGHHWKCRLAIKGEESDKPTAAEFRRVTLWMHYRLRPHYEKMMQFLDGQVLRQD